MKVTRVNILQIRSSEGVIGEARYELDKEAVVYGILIHWDIGAGCYRLSYRDPQEKHLEPPHYFRPICPHLTRHIEREIYKELEKRWEESPPLPLEEGKIMKINLRYQLTQLGHNKKLKFSAIGRIRRFLGAGKKKMKKILVFYLAINERQKSKIS